MIAQPCTATAQAGRPCGTVLLLAGSDDSTAELVAASLDRTGARFARFDTADFPQRAGIDARLRGGRWVGALDGPGGPVDLADIAAVYVRRPGPFDPPAHLTGAERWHAATEARYGVGGVLASLPVRWCNRPSASADAAYKPRQVVELAAAGLTVPPTLITTDPARVRAFAARHERIVCKPVAIGVLHTGTGAHSVYTRLLDDADLADLSGVEHAPHLFQPFVPKLYEVRLTMVGEECFAVRIDAGSARSRVDWRADYPALSYRLVDTPPEVRAGARAYLDAAGLAFGAFDVIVTPDERWVVLECNPEGQWEWLAAEIGAPIADAIARHLTREPV